MDNLTENDIKIKHPFRLLCAGASGTGKTTFTARLLKNLKYMVDTEFDTVIFSYSQEQPIYEEIKKCDENIVWVEGFDQDIESRYLTNVDENKLVVFDDQMETLCNDFNFQTFFTRKSHHMNISIIFLVQNLYFKSKCMRTINLNTTAYALFKSPRDTSQVYTLARQLYPGISRFMIDSYKDASSKSFGYLFIDIDPRTRDFLRLRTSIFPEEHLIIYKEREKK